MFYDQKWERPSLAGFIAWLEQKDPKQTFGWLDCRTCVVGQYFDSVGTDWMREWNRDSGMVCTLDSCAQNHPCTFGAVLEKAKCKQV